jgi:hypothetical protein
MSFGTKHLDDSTTSHAHKWGKEMTVIAARIGRMLAKKRDHETLGEADRELLKGADAQGFKESVIDKLQKAGKSLWFVKLFDEVIDKPITKGSWKKLPFSHRDKALIWNVDLRNFQGNGSCIRRVIIEDGDDGRLHGDSDTSPAGSFEEIVVKFRAAHANLVNAIGESMVQEAIEFRGQTERIEVELTNPIAVVNDTLAKYDGEDLHAFDMHLISLIHPQRWYDYGDTRLSEHIRRLATRAARLATPTSRRNRRLHVVSQSIQTELSNLICLADTMLDSLTRHLDSRAILVEAKEIEYRSGVPMIKDILLMDCGAFSKKGGKHGVIISNVRPYFEAHEETQREAKRGVYSIPPQRQRACYYFLRHNFQKLWNASEDYPVEVWRIPKVIAQLETLLEDEKIKTKWKTFLPAKGKAHFHYFTEEQLVRPDTLRSALSKLAPPIKEGTSEDEDEDADEVAFTTHFFEQGEYRAEAGGPDPRHKS